MNCRINQIKVNLHLGTAFLNNKLAKFEKGVGETGLK
jgi:hypothetical protein